MPATASRAARRKKDAAIEEQRGLIDLDGLRRLFAALAEDGYRVLGPTVRDGAVVYDELASADALPVGWTAETERGTYRLKRRGDAARFGYAVGPQSWKRHLFPARRRLWSAEKQGNGTFAVASEADVPQPTAFVGVRACELAAIALQDRIFMDGPFPDPVYAARRRSTFIVAVNCTGSAATCFCASTGTGPQVPPGFDLALTELVGPDRHAFLVASGSTAGAALLAKLPARPAADADVEAGRAAVAQAAATQQRRLDLTGLRTLLLANLEHPHWDQVAARCLACASCTLVCPTCFCSTVEDTTDLSGRRTERWQQWDSCFTVDFSYIHGGSVRTSGRARYRQWATHKLATWIDQFGATGCVGCGRCIAWCPVGIDLTEEMHLLREKAEHPPVKTEPSEP